MDFEVIYSEILAQYTKAGTVEEKIWITYLEEGIGKLEEDYRLQVTIADRQGLGAGEWVQGEALSEIKLISTWLNEREHNAAIGVSEKIWPYSHCTSCPFANSVFQ
jgi:hypothetical protein